MPSKDYDKIRNEESVFTGNTFELVGIELVSALLSVITLTLATPWLICWKQRWITSHTYIDGKQQYFDGTGMQLSGKWIQWIVLSIITFGLYTFFLAVKARKWVVKHTHMINSEHITYRTKYIHLCPKCGKAYVSETIQPGKCDVCKGTRALYSGFTKTEWLKLSKEERNDITEKITGHKAEAKKSDPKIFRCPFCNAMLPSDSIFCSSCGRSLMTQPTENDKKEIADNPVTLVEPEDDRPGQLENNDADSEMVTPQDSKISQFFSPPDDLEE